MPHEVSPDMDQPDLLTENQALRARISSLLEYAESNQALLSRHQAFDLELIAAGTFIELVNSIFHTLPFISGLDRVTLSLLDEDNDILNVMERLGVDFATLPDLILVHSKATLGFARIARPKPLLGRFDRVGHKAAFPNAATGLASIARVPLLRNQRLIGSLNLGSCDPSRFTQNLATDFMEHMASIIAICLENVISNEILKYIGLTDALTGVYNRRYIDRRLQEEISRARRQDYHISFIYIDIDHFKRINDTIGHQGGDEVLREAALRIRGELRLSDALARFGGEEFVALLINSDLDSTAVVAERIRASIADLPFVLAGASPMTVTVSLGVASLNQVEAEGPVEAVAQLLIGHADAALYQAKSGGRNRVVSYRPPAPVPPA